MEEKPVGNTAYYKNTSENVTSRTSDVNTVKFNDITLCISPTKSEKAPHGHNEEEHECFCRINYDKIKETLLNAVHRGALPVVEALFDGNNLDTAFLEGEQGGYYWCKENFPPLIVAAQNGNSDITRFFLSRGYGIETPHDTQCACDRCHLDYLKTSQKRLSLYKALANPIWIVMTSEDPILTAFSMSTKMKSLASQEDEFEKEYSDLYKSSKQLAVSLLGECYGSNEQETILHYSHKDNTQAINGDRRLDLLKMAISMHQKEFVAHTFSQHLLMSLIFKCAKGWRNNNIIYKIRFVTTRVLIFPLMAVAYIVLPCWNSSITMKEPLIKFINHTVAFVIFLLLLALSSTQSLKLRAGDTPSGLEFLIICYVLGLMWSEYKQLWSEGLLRYLSSGWNWMDLSMLLMLFGAFFIWTTVAIKASFSSSNYTEQLKMIISIADGFYAAGIVMSFFRLIYLCQISRYLGLLQLCLSRMVRVIAQFAFISCVVLWSFSIGMHMLYNSSKHYPSKNSTRQSFTNNNNITNIEENGFIGLSWHGDYNGLLNSVVTMSWASFNMIELTSLKAFDNTNMIQFWSAALFTVYHASTMIVLLNMLIAMMANSYQQIEDNIEIEYKFARAQMWVEFFDDVATLPTPFNIIPTPKTIYRIFYLIIEKIWGKSWGKSYHVKKRFSLHRAGTIDSSQRKQAYLKLSAQLVKRYLAKRSLSEKRTDADSGMLQAIESSKTELRQTLKEIIQFIELRKKKENK